MCVPTVDFPQNIPAARALANKNVFHGDKQGLRELNEKMIESTQ